MPSDIAVYNASQTGENKKICAKLKEILTKELPKAESKVWHKSPVWFLEGNPIVGYSVRKNGVQVLFWSGQSFVENGLKPEGEGTFKAAEVYYASVDDMKITALRKWLGQAKRIQWDYKNIVKKRGVLDKVGKW